MEFSSDFSGAKLALFLGGELLVIKRDDKPEIPYPGHWDLPGGGREGLETPLECALRETREEVGLRVPPSAIHWTRNYMRPRGEVWFFVAGLPAQAVRNVRFGSEGQGWRLMAADTYVAHPLAVPHFADQLETYLRQHSVANQV